MSESALSPSSRTAVALAALLAVPVLLLADTGIALARGWEPRSGLYRGIIAASFAAVLGAAVLAAVPASRRLLARRWAAVALAAASLALGWAAVEGVALAFPGLLASGPGHSRGPGVRRVFRPDPRWVSGIHGPSLYTTNDLGIRGGPLPAGGRKLLCVGGSATECTYLDDAETWPHRLMEELSGAGPVWVGNLGISGYATAEHLDLLERSPLPEGLEGVVFLTGVNDLVRFLNGSLELGPRPLWRRTALAGALLAHHRRRFLRHLLYAVEDPTGESLVERRRTRREGGDAGPLPPLDRALGEYGGRIEALARTCRQRGLRCVFLTQPVLWKDGLGPEARTSLWMGEDGHGRFFAPGELRRGLDRYNGALLAASARAGVETVDLSSLSGREDLFYDDCHFTEAGAREVARLVAARLLGPGGERR